MLKISVPHLHSYRMFAKWLHRVLLDTYKFEIMSENEPNSKVRLHTDISPVSHDRIELE